jgi:hypothetical protein
LAYAIAAAAAFAKHAALDLRLVEKILTSRSGTPCMRGSLSSEREEIADVEADAELDACRRFGDRLQADGQPRLAEEVEWYLDLRAHTRGGVGLAMNVDREELRYARDRVRREPGLRARDRFHGAAPRLP